MKNKSIGQKLLSMLVLLCILYSAIPTAVMAEEREASLMHPDWYGEGVYGVEANSNDRAFFSTPLVLTTVSVGTKEALQSAINNPAVDAIRITADMHLTAALAVGRSITFIADSPKTIKATNTRHMIIAGSDITLTFQNVALDGSHTGGGIMAASDNQALTLKGLTMQNCHTAGFGGGISIFNGKLTVLDSFFRGNTTNGNGGVVLGSNAEITINNCVISNNAGLTGGAIYTYEGRINIQNSMIKENAAIHSGGVVATSHGNVAVSNSTFSGNTAETGGAVYLLTGTIAAENCEFSKNSADTYGGAIWTSRGAIVAKNDTFYENTANNSGGALFTQNGTGTIEECTFTKNTAAAMGGGAIGIFGGTANVKNSKFIENSTGGNGGAINNRSVLYIEESSFYKNRSLKDGGAVDNNNGGEITITKSRFEQNQAEGNGGALNDVVSVIHIRDSAFVQNIAKKHGGAIYIDFAYLLNINGNTAFSGNSASTAFDYGLENKGAAGMYPNMNWESVSITGTHVLNNYDVAFARNPIYIILYKANGGTAADRIETAKVGTTHTVLSGSKAGMSRSGYTFLGWSNTPSSAAATYTGSEKIGGTASNETTIILYAIWSKNPEPASYPVTYDPNGGKGTAYNTTASVNYSILKNESGNLGYSREGYVFAGWSTDAKAAIATYNGGEAVTLTGAIKLYAVWRLEQHQHYAYVVGYPDGTVKPNQNIIREEVAAILLRIMEERDLKASWKTTNAFPDVGNRRWSNQAVSTLADIGVVKGYPDGRFGPMVNITRAEFAAMLVRLAGVEGQTAAGNHFPDVKSTSWAVNEINLAYELNLVVGYQDGSFRPNKAITRAEAMTMINRLQGRRIKSSADLLQGMAIFSDNADAKKWYYLEVQEATNSHFCTICAEDANGVAYEKWTKHSGTPDWSLLSKQGFAIHSFVYPKG